MKRLTSLIAASILASLTLTLPALASGKGGEKLAALTSTKAKVQATTPARTMSCPTITKTVVDRSATRGAFKKSSTVTDHACPTCETSEAVKGAGKLAVRKLEHTCQAANVCCKVN